MKSPQSFPRFSRIIILTLLPVFSLTLGWNLGSQFEQELHRERERQLEELFRGKSGSGQIFTDPEQSVDITVLWSAWRLLQSHFIDPAKLVPEVMVHGAVKGMVESLGDPYTLFMTPKENAEFHDALDGHLQGIGAELAERHGQILIVTPIKGAPAEKAGLLPDDVIVEVDGTAIEGMGLSDVVTRIRGKKGTKVTLMIERHGETELLKFVITRDDITVPSVDMEMKRTATGTVAYISVNQFGSDTTVEMIQSVQNVLKEKNIKGLILDLRYNGGGFLEGAVDMSSLFLRQGKVVSVERRNADPQRHYVSGRPLLPDLPMAVLINQGTASAAEIVAGALQDHERAIIVGMKSFGKGTVQEVIDLPGGGSLRVTSAQWLTPSGRNLGKEGVTPDIEVDRSKEDFDSGFDPQLNRALEILTEGE